jgi:hypothetical protein
MVEKPIGSIPFTDAAERFVKRHNIDVCDDDPELSISAACHPGKSAAHDLTDRAGRLRPLWRQILKRITGSPDGIAYGYVGYYVD